MGCTAPMSGLPPNPSFKRTRPKAARPLNSSIVRRRGNLLSMLRRIVASVALLVSASAGALFPCSSPGHPEPGPVLSADRKSRSCAGVGCSVRAPGIEWLWYHPAWGAGRDTRSRGIPSLTLHATPKDHPALVSTFKLIFTARTQMRLYGATSSRGPSHHGGGRRRLWRLEECAIQNPTRSFPALYVYRHAQGRHGLARLRAMSEVRIEESSSPSRRENSEPVPFPRVRSIPSGH
jgi:hypothetical protein